MRLDVSGRPLSLFQQNCVTRSRAETKRDCLANILYIISARRSFLILRSAALKADARSKQVCCCCHTELEVVDRPIRLILDSTSVILLFDPEHITAANARKRICLAYRTRSQTEQVKRLKDELWFTQFLLTSKLKRHNKSPTLWSHRKWLIKNFNTLEGLLGPKWVEYEIEDVILRSAEHHPKNYYAWDYMRWWIQSRPGLDTTRWSREVNVPLAMLMQAWCLHHTSDSSGWSFLTWIHKSPESNSLEGQQLVAAAGKKVLDCAVSMNLKNPSLWKFLQDILGCTTTSALSEVRFEYIGQLQKMRSSEPQGSTMQKFGENSLLHIYAYENPPDYG
ncbi:hypothetical protein O988_08006 [Pseudogymnoascus sp. VKM F-3808]|nr:hypothetical protein O988_08006 [Pseudogymnoascus sp. VKM F-3808]